MTSFENFFTGLLVAVQPVNLFYCFIGCLAGTLVGVLPGIGPTAAVALLLPATFHMDPIAAIIMLSGIAYGSAYGGSTTSILVNVPGEACSVVTCLDGYQMAKKGRAGPALGIAAFGSFIAGTLAIVGVMLLAPTLARAALAFGSPEYFSLMLMSMMVVTYLVKGSIPKALIMVALGLLLGTVGMDPMTGRDRFVFDLPQLKDGIGMIPIAIGMFGVTEILETIGATLKKEVFAEKVRGYWPDRRDWKASAGPLTRGTLLGFLLGIFPGLSPMIPTFLSYGIEQRLSKHPEKFGTGVIEGVAAPEACNNAAATAGYVPLLSLGIPSNAFNAVLLGALMIHGLQPGPMLINSNPTFFWGVLASMYLGNIMLLVLNLPLIPLWVKVLKIPYNLLAIMILIFCFLGAYSINGNVFDVIITFAFGIFGYLLKRFGFERPPLILAFVLGPLVETAFRQSLISSSGSFMIFVTRPLSAVFLLIAAGVLASACFRKRTLVEKLDQD
ncbi:MAG: tripartite tricarboxylate transporter permease [Deltaproteobacteria bacterium]|nr:tripartite tricarboxylate transporter permease [Deltaproteobacteria bacterium]